MSSSPTPSSTSTLHPLHLPPSSPFAPASSTFASTSAYDPTSSSSSSRAPSPVSRGVRSRKPSPLPPTPSDLNLFSNNDSADVTRPNLRKATKDALGLAGRGSETENESGRYSAEEKGKQRESKRAASEALYSEKNTEREVVVHKVLKTDTMASVSLQYGITQQALRKANRLWATDPIHLRPNLLIPLDQCNLPSSSFGLERIAREENGDITVWKREAPTSPSRRTDREGLSVAAGRSEKEHHIISPTARRLISTSSFETSPIPAGSDFLAIWDETPSSSSRPSLDSVRSSTGSTTSSSHAPRPSFSPQISSYLSLTNNPYSSSPSLGPSPPLPTSQDLVDATNHTPMSPPLIPAKTPDYSSSASQASTSLSPAPSSSSNTTPPSDTGANGTLTKRTLKIERLPASQLSFFPPHANEDSPSTTPKPTPSESTTKSPSEDLFFGPLTNSLASSFSSLGLNKYLPTSFSSSNLYSKSGSIALPLSRTNSSSSDMGMNRSSSMRGWNLDFFGGEEEHAPSSFAKSAISRSRSTLGLNGASDSRRRKGENQVSSLNGIPRRTSEIGLEDVTMNDEVRPSGPNGRKKDRDSNGRVNGGGNRARGDVRETFGLL
ncbi:hypothetical protein JCM5353_005233 [Sporobolomyces roseus]